MLYIDLCDVMNRSPAVNYVVLLRRLLLFQKLLSIFPPFHFSIAAIQMEKNETV